VEIPGLSVAILRELFRNLQAFRSYYMAEHEDTIRDHLGREWCLWDIEYLYEQRHLLSPRQCEAIELCLYRNMTEETAAVQMGVSPTNPVAMYATDGLRKLVLLIEEGALRRPLDVEVREAS
jgi:predicted DNA-binding protein (UPF0251 family)